MTIIIKKEYYRSEWKSIAGKIGPKITFIMGILFLIEGIIRLSLWYFFYPDTSLVLMCGILAIVGGLLGLKEYNYGRFLCLIAGILAIIGFLIFYDYFGFRFLLWVILMIVPIAYFIFFINLVSPFIFLIGGILSVISEESFFNTDREKE